MYHNIGHKVGINFNFNKKKCYVCNPLNCKNPLPPNNKKKISQTCKNIKTRCKNCLTLKINMNPYLCKCGQCSYCIIKLNKLHKLFRIFKINWIIKYNLLKK